MVDMGEEHCDESMVVVRELDVNKDRERVEAMEKICEVGPSGKLSLFTDLMGDPICRVRHSPAFLMLVLLLLFFYYTIHHSLILSPSLFFGSTVHTLFLFLPLPSLNL